jgi:hypothetical protein
MMKQDVLNQYIQSVADQLDWSTAQWNEQGRIESVTTKGELSIPHGKLPPGTLLGFKDQKGKDWLYCARIDQQSDFFGIHCQPGTKLTFHFSDPPQILGLKKAAKGLLEKDGLKISGKDEIVFDFDGKVLFYTTAEDCAFGTHVLPNGSRVEKRADGYHVSLGKEAVIGGVSFGSKTDLSFDPGLHLQRALSKKPVEIHSRIFPPKTLLHFLPDERLDRVQMFMAGTIPFVDLTPEEVQEYQRRFPPEKQRPRR